MPDVFAGESIEPKRGEVQPDMPDLEFSEGERKAWFVVVEKRE